MPTLLNYTCKSFIKLTRYLGSDTSPLWNFCTRFSDVTSRENPSSRQEMSAIFLDYIFYYAKYLGILFLYHYTFLGNCSPTPPISQHFALVKSKC